MERLLRMYADVQKLLLAGTIWFCWRGNTLHLHCSWVEPIMMSSLWTRTPPSSSRWCSIYTLALPFTKWPWMCKSCVSVLRSWVSWTWGLEWRLSLSWWDSRSSLCSSAAAGSFCTALRTTGHCQFEIHLNLSNHVNNHPALYLLDEIQYLFLGNSGVPIPKIVMFGSSTSHFITVYDAVYSMFAFGNHL